MNCQLFVFLNTYQFEPIFNQITPIHSVFPSENSIKAKSLADAKFKKIETQVIKTNSDSRNYKICDGYSTENLEIFIGNIDGVKIQNTFSFKLSDFSQECLLNLIQLRKDFLNIEVINQFVFSLDTINKDRKSLMFKYLKDNSSQPSKIFFVFTDNQNDDMYSKLKKIVRNIENTLQPFTDILEDEIKNILKPATNIVINRQETFRLVEKINALESISAKVKRVTIECFKTSIEYMELVSYNDLYPTKVVMKHHLEERWEALNKFINASDKFDQTLQEFLELQLRIEVKKLNICSLHKDIIIKIFNKDIHNFICHQSSSIPQIFEELKKRIIDASKIVVLETRALAFNIETSLLEEVILKEAIPLSSEIRV
ncbi:hypothetical protein CDIK_0542 [Cucumispora dikerogammari]|nr:hypothetical protein CDIK_0542 [Cucumispora dikerogammari]